MTESLNLKDLEDRSTRYWHADGLPELVMGLLWMLWGGAWLVGQAMPRGAIWNVFWMLTPAVLALTGVAAVRIIKQLKAHYTFPRAGYVEWKEPTRTRRLVAAGAALVSAALVALLVVKGRTEGIERVAAPGLGVLLSLAFVVASLTQKAPHLLALAGVALALGLVFGALHAGWDGLNWMLVGVGAATALSGALRLAQFLKRNPVEARGD